MQSLVFFDLDGTLLNEKSVITPEVEDVLIQLKAKGHLPIIATGRPYSQIKHILENTVIDSYILVNGQMIVLEKKTIYQSVFDKDEIREFNRLANRYQIPLAFYGRDSHVISENTTTVQKALTYFNIPVPSVEKEYYINNDVLMMLLFTEDLNHDKFFKTLFPSMNFYRTSPHSIDIIHSYNSKSRSIDKLRESMSAESLPTYAFGDGMNDIEMLKNATFSVAMGNAIEEAKEVSDIVVSSNSENGIIEGLEYFDLI
ncbi:Cof-type HAD-IIB family hydrolase [Ruoffia tabacinasalis]|uniref:Cof-type HAD-IIB family hydrolase n=1 Tax=Ruoffia tabacinasalis TaxID=87458 RepID=UPI003F99F6FB